MHIMLDPFLSSIKNILILDEKYAFRASFIEFLGEAMYLCCRKGF
jgi:hypothetical protein